MARTRGRKERYRTGRFVALSEGGAPIFELDGEQVAEFGIDQRALVTAIVVGLIERSAWMMLVPPHRGYRSWTLHVELASVPYVEKRLNETGGLYLTRGPHCPDNDGAGSEKKTASHQGAPT